MLTWYNNGKLTDVGASTLKGRSGEYAAGNGAAMRIAPLAFFINPDTKMMKHMLGLWQSFRLTTNYTHFGYNLTQFGNKEFLTSSDFYIIKF